MRCESYCPGIDEMIFLEFKPARMVHERHLQY